MIIKDESIFFRIDGKYFPAKDLLFIDAVRHLTQMIDISYNRLISTSQSTDNHLQNEFALIDGWAMIGSINRLRTLLEKMPNISHNLLWYKKYYQQIKDVKHIRDFIEHFDEKIQSQTEKDNFMIGYISCFELRDDNSFVGSLFYSLRIKNEIDLQVDNPAGKRFRGKIDHVTFYLNDSKVSLSDIYYGLIVFIENFEIYIKSRVNKII